MQCFPAERGAAAHFDGDRLARFSLEGHLVVAKGKPLDPEGAFQLLVLGHAGADFELRLLAFLKADFRFEFHFDRLAALGVLELKTGLDAKFCLVALGRHGGRQFELDIGG